MNQHIPHHFHIPVMGLAYTVDTPIKVARFGINSVLTIVEDRLLEMMRSYYYPTIDQPYIPISHTEPDYRAKRTTDYLNLVNKIVYMQVEQLRNLPFEPGSEIVKYFELLPDDSALKKLYIEFQNCEDLMIKTELEKPLRSFIKAGSIDVNIMTKVDRNVTDKDGAVVEDGSDAVAALRGFANSNLTNASVVFSAGMNPRLFNYLEKCPQFDMKEDGSFDKKIIIKVSDYRSALIQGKYLAKKGIWVSEFRIESGLNCGGHAFATDGFLLGSILEEFKTNKEDLTQSLFDLYSKALLEKTGKTLQVAPPICITVQGGIGTHEEDEFLLKNYPVTSTGWGTPFLLVPEATTVDNDTLELLRKSTDKDLELSRHSPLGVRFHYLKGTTSDQQRMHRIHHHTPGGACYEKHLVSNTEFSNEPICTASSEYQKKKIEQLKSMNLPEEEYQKQYTEVVEKECLCVGLSNAAAMKYDTTFIKKNHAVTICPGPNIKYFNKVVSLQTMVDHIYGRTDILECIKRPNFLINELHLYIDYLKEQLIADMLLASNPKQKKYFKEFYHNLLKGIEYYQQLDPNSFKDIQAFYSDLDKALAELYTLNTQFNILEN